MKMIESKHSITANSTFAHTYALKKSHAPCTDTQTQPFTLVFYLKRTIYDLLYFFFKHFNSRTKISILTDDLLATKQKRNRFYFIAINDK